MKVLVECLWSTESIRVACTEVHVLDRIITQVCTRAEDDAVDEAVLVQTATHEEAPDRVSPLILEICAPDLDVLLCQTTITPHVITHMI